MRTVVNILGDSLGAAIVFHLSQRDLEKLSHVDPDDF